MQTTVGLVPFQLLCRNKLNKHIHTVTDVENNDNITYAKYNLRFYALPTVTTLLKENQSIQNWPCCHQYHQAGYCICFYFHLFVCKNNPEH